MLVANMKNLINELHSSKGSVGRCEFIEAIMRVKGKRYSLDNYPMFRFLYDLNNTVVEKVLKTGRQTSKSTFNSKNILTNMLTHSFFQALYVVPLKDQTVRFSHNYAGHDIENTPFIYENYIDSNVIKNVFSRGLSNGSLLQLTYAMLDAERARGIPSDEVIYDEVQNIPIDNIPIINECLSASEFKLRSYT